MTAVASAKALEDREAGLTRTDAGIETQIPDSGGETRSTPLDRHFVEAWTLVSLLSSVHADSHSVDRVSLSIFR